MSADLSDGFSAKARRTAVAFWCALAGIVFLSCSDRSAQTAFVAARDTIVELRRERDSLAAILTTLQETPGYFLTSARAARAAGDPQGALEFLADLETRFADSDDAREGRSLRREIRNEIARGVRERAETQLEGNSFASARSAVKQLEREFRDTPAAMGLATLANRIDRAERTWRAKQEEARARRAEEAARANADLEIIDWRWSTSYGYATAEGRVKNISGRRLENVTARVTWKDGSGGFITSDNSLIDLDPILPEQTSTFKVMARANPAMKTASLSFEYLFGGTILTYRRDK